MSNTTKIVHLQLWDCFFLESKDRNYTTLDPHLIISCRSQGRYLTGQRDGPIICLFLCVLVYIIGIFGFAANIMNVSVLRKTLAGSAISLKRLLITLALFDLLACLFSISFATVLIVMLENTSRGEVTMYWLKISQILFSFGRTGAVYITILVTIERYLVIAFPFKSKQWLTPFKSKIYVIIVLILTFFLNLSWIFNNTIAKNPYAKLSPNTSLHDFPYILSDTYFGKHIYKHIRMPLLLANYVAPFPLLLFFNGLLYFTIHRWHKQSIKLSRTQKREINTAKMFSVVVIILLSCHTVSCMITFFAQYINIVHRELMFLQLVSVTLSAAVNFFVYFGFGKPFRQELRKQLAMLTGRNQKEIKPKEVIACVQVYSS